MAAQLLDQAEHVIAARRAEIKASRSPLAQAADVLTARTNALLDELEPQRRERCAAAKARAVHTLDEAIKDLERR
jgi:prefoldin subunit 5